MTIVYAAILIGGFAVLYGLWLTVPWREDRTDWS